jgi:hypothetical protein
VLVVVGQLVARLRGEPDQLLLDALPLAREQLTCVVVVHARSVPAHDR